MPRLRLVARRREHESVSLPDAQANIFGDGISIVLVLFVAILVSLFLILMVVRVDTGKNKKGEDPAKLQQQLEKMTRERDQLQAQKEALEAEKGQLKAEVAKLEAASKDKSKSKKKERIPASEQATGEQRAYRVWQLSQNTVVLSNPQAELHNGKLMWHDRFTCRPTNNWTPAGSGGGGGASNFGIAQ